MIDNATKNVDKNKYFSFNIENIKSYNIQSKYGALELDSKSKRNMSWITLL